MLFEERAVAIETAPTIKQANFWTEQMLRLRTENMEVIIRLINSKESNPEASVSWDDDSKMLRMSFLKIVKGFLLH